MKKIMFLIMFLTACELPKEPKKMYHKWQIKTCNEVGCDYYDCDKFTKDSNVYKMYNADTLVNQVQVGNNVTVKISINTP